MSKTTKTKKLSWIIEMFIRIQVTSPVSLGGNMVFFWTRYIFCVSWRRKNYRFTYDFIPFYQTFGKWKWPKFRSFALPENFQNWLCCADSTPGLKSITINKRKLNNKHTQRTQEFTWFGKLPTSTETTEKFHYKK